MRARSRGPESGPLTGAPNPNCISASEHGGSRAQPTSPSASAHPQSRHGGSQPAALMLIKMTSRAGGKGDADDGNDAKPYKARDGAGARLLAGGDHRGWAHDLA